MSSTDLQTVPDLTADAVRRMTAYTDEITYYGENSVGLALARTIAEQTAQNGNRLQRALIRRETLLGASGTTLDEVLEEHGVPRLGPSRALVPVILQPWKATVTAITGAGAIEVDDSSQFTAGDSIRLTNSDGSESEILDILSISSGTGPNQGDEVTVSVIVGTYSPTTETVSVLLRVQKLAGTVFTSTTGIAFESMEDVWIGDSNPVLQGESAALALADKVWCEARTPGAAGNVEALTIESLQTPDPQVRALFNPGRAVGGSDSEPDFDAKFRASHQGQLVAVETTAALEALARNLDTDVLRAFYEDADDVSTLRLRVLTRAGGGLSVQRRSALKLAMEARLRSRMGVEIVNVEPVSIEVTGTISLDPGEGTAQERLEAAWRAACDRYATFLDWRKWEPETPVDEADLLSILNSTPGVANVVTSTFTPSSDTTIPAATVPMFVRLHLTDITSGATFGATLATSY